MKEEDVTASLKELAEDSGLLLKTLEMRIKELNFQCWKYKSMRGAEKIYYEHAHLKKVYNILKYLYGGFQNKK